MPTRHNKGYIQFTSLEAGRRTESHPPVLTSANPEIVPAYEVSCSDQARVFSDSFVDYIAGPISVDDAGFARLLFLQGADLWLSRLVRLDGRWVGYGFIGRTANLSRLAGMGFIPEVRGRGLGGRLLRHLLEEARNRGERLMTLEVFEQNAPAVAAYRREGFRQVGRLLGWKSADGPVPLLDVPNLTDVSIEVLFNAPQSCEYPDWPWQISRSALANLPPGAQAVRSGSVALVYSESASESIRIHAALTLQPGAMDWPGLRALLCGLQRRIPPRRWFAPAIFPEVFGQELFGPLGFQREALNQFHMQREL